jgi:hypothetical protein
MRATFSAFVFLFATTLCATVFAATGLVVHTTEFGVGKFHRYDNKVHPYGAQNAWTPYILADGAATDKALTVKNADGSYTVFFSTLDEMMKSVVAISQSEGKKVSVLNVHGHGLPGAMWFPKDEATRSGWMCGDWNAAASGADVDNYNQYYGAVSVSEIMQMRQMSNNPNVHMACTTGAREWREGVANNPAFKAALDSEAQFHFLSCIVGLGSVGDQFTKDIASIVLGQSGHVQTSMAFGLGDWSMPEGMGFWDYQSDDQVNHDNSNYTVHHTDREIMQKGSVRMASFTSGAWSTTALTDRQFMLLSFEPNLKLGRVLSPEFEAPLAFSQRLPQRVRVPGTSGYVYVEQP